MFIGIAALVLAVSAYIFKEGLPADIVTRLATAFGFVTAQNAPKTITDGSENATSVELNGTSNGDASYKANLPSRKLKEEILITNDLDVEEEDGEKTPTSSVKIELSIPDVEIKPEPVKDQPRARRATTRAKTKGRRGQGASQTRKES